MTGTTKSDPAPLHVVHVISGLGQGGAETVLHRLVTAPGQINRYTVISMTDEGVFGERLRSEGITVLTLDMPSGRLSIAGLRRLYGLLRTLAPDVVQTWMYHADLIGGTVARLAGIRAVSWGIRNSGANLQKGSRIAKASAWLCTRLSGVVPAVIVSCADDAAERHQQWGYRADRMLVIPNGYDLSRWQSDPAARTRLRTQWGLAEDTPLIGNVGRWNPLKDHANLLGAMALSLKSFPNLRCVLVGYEITDRNADLMALIDQFGLRDKVILLGMREDVPSIMNALDVHVLSSCAEGFPNVVAEAMAVGVVNVVTDVGDAAKIVAAEGWVARPQDAAALSQAIDQAVAALGTPEMSDRVARGRERVGRLFSLQTMVAAYQQVWARLAKDFPARGGAEARKVVALQKGIELQTGVAADAAARISVSTDAGSSQIAQRRLLIVVNNPAFFLSHRLPLALGALQAGFEVHVATMDGPSIPKIIAHGLHHHVIPMSRSGKNPIEELQTTWALWRLYRRVRPAVVHAVTIKPVLYGGIAARLAGVPTFIAAVSGLGFIFTRQRPGFDFVRWTATLLYRFALGHSNSRVIFQNRNDRDVLRKANVVRPEQVVLIRGSGVDLEHYKATPEPQGAPIAIMVSRLLIDKGVREFVAAARVSAGHPSGLRWVLAGSPDTGNPATITESEVEQWKREGVVEFLGEQSNIAELYRQSHIAVLPSYREGLPKSLLEAAACARAVVTTDVPGCRDAIEPDVTGILVPARDATALSLAVQRLATDADLRRRLGAAGRELAEREFDIRHVVKVHVDLYETLSS